MWSTKCTSPANANGTGPLVPAAELAAVVDALVVAVVPERSGFTEPLLHAASAAQARVALQKVADRFTIDSFRNLLQSAQVPRVGFEPTLDRV